MHQVMKRLLGEHAGCWVFWLRRVLTQMLPCLLAEARLCHKRLRDSWRYRSDPEVLLAHLRTAAHIVDKGLQAPCCEPGRSKSPYATAKALLDSLAGSRLQSDNSYRWAAAKVVAYQCFQTGGEQESVPYVPPADPSGASEQLMKLIKGRRSVRRFREGVLDAAVLERLAEAANWAASSCNRQPIELFLTQSKDLVRDCLAQCQGATCLGAPLCFVAVCGDTRAYSMRDRHLPLIDVSLGLQNLMLMAHALGVEGTVLNWMHASQEQERALRRILGIPQYCTIVVGLILGFPDAGAPPPARKNEEAVLHFVR